MAQTLDKIVYKDKQSAERKDYDIGIDASKVYYTDPTDDKTYTLDQILASYLKFIKESNFVYSGDSEPLNKRMSIWIDTSSSSSNTSGTGA